MAPSGVIWLALGLLLVSAFFRLYRLDGLPPGMFVDVATNGLDIRDVLAGHLPVFFARNYGREALFIYFQALLVAGAGPQPFVFAFSAVTMGMLTIALSCRLFAAMFGWRTGLLAASLLAVSFWFVDLSRFGLRTMSLPPLLVATLYLLWRTLRTGGWRYSALTGVALGLSLYTYIASRLLPLLVVSIWLAEWRTALKYWRQLALLVLVSLAVFAPEGVYFWQHRSELLLRSSQVSVFNPNPEVEGSHDTPLGSILNTAGMFFVRGDENIRHNIPHRPVFDPVLGALFAAGLGFSLWQARRKPHYRWPLLWLAVMCLPSALSHESPNSFRIVSAAPAACFFPGLALGKLEGWLPWRRIAYVLVGLVLAGSAALTFYLYFGQWAHNSRAYWAFDGNLTPLASFVSAQTQPGQTYFALDHRSTVQFLAPVSLTDRWYREESAAIPIPAQAANTVYVSGPKAALADEALRMLPGAEAVPHTTAPDGSPDFVAFRWASGALLSRSEPLDISMGADFRLTGYEMTTSGGKPALDLLWKAIRAKGPYDLYVHLLDANGKQVAQSDRLVWPVDKGPAKDDLLLTQHPLAVPPGAYTAEIGAVHRSVMNRDQLVGPAIGVTRLPVTVP
ncbi:MAG TPA: glycosyltransferase family 39 protein [Chloroflexota bacterium]|nr:glycosyltransferase family 39 protein [Chloroflexota bacterium]